MSATDGSKGIVRVRSNGRSASATGHVAALAPPIAGRRRVPRDRKNRNGGRIGTQVPVRRRRTINWASARHPCHRYRALISAGERAVREVRQ